MYCVQLLRDPAVCIFVTGATRRVEERQEVEVKMQKLWGLSLGRHALLCRVADI